MPREWDAPGVAAKKKTTKSFSKQEKAAMKDRAAEQRAARSRKGAAGKQADAADVLAKIAEFEEADREIATRVHALVAEVAPHLDPKTWYGMPAWALNGKVVLFFQSAARFKSRYSTLGFSDTAALDDGAMWPTAFALTQITPAVEKRIRELVARAAPAQ